MKNLNKILTLFGVFFKISLLTLGGGLAMLPIIQREFSEKRLWISDNDMLDTVAVVQSMPGVMAMNMAVLVGHRIFGIAGAFAAALGCLIPPFFVILLLVEIVTRFRENPLAEGLFLGIRAGVAAIILGVAIKLFKKTCRHWLDYLLFFASFILIAILHMNAAWIIIVAMLVSPLIYFIKK